MGYLHKVRKNLLLTTKLTVNELMDETNDDLSEEYLILRQIKNREHIK